MRLQKWTIGLVGTSLLSLAVLGSLFFFSTFSQPLFECVDKAQKEVPSPNGIYIATIFERDCGATTDFAAHVNLRPNREHFDGQKFSSVLILRGRPQIALEWKDDTHLAIRYSESQQAFRKSATWNQVHIAYASY